MQVYSTYIVRFYPLKTAVSPSICHMTAPSAHVCLWNQRAIHHDTSLAGLMLGDTVAREAP